MWPRACAMLIRQALETGVDAIWLASPGTASLTRSSMRSQLTCLPAYIDPQLAGEISYIWVALSEACHYHAYELAPTAVELADWIAAVDRLLVRNPAARMASAPDRKPLRDGDRASRIPRHRTDV